MTGPSLEVRTSYRDALAEEFQQEEWWGDKWLPDELRSLPAPVMHDLLGLLDAVQAGEPRRQDIWGFPDLPPEPEDREHTDPAWCSAVRGEVTLPCFEPVLTDGAQVAGLDAEGFPFFYLLHRESELSFRCVIDDQHPALSTQRQNFADRNGWKWIDSVVPRRSRYRSDTESRLTRLSIAPWSPTAATPIDAATQQSRIDNHLLKWPLDLRSLVLYGAYNTSKTTFAAAYLTDVVTARVAITQAPERGEFHPCVWAINLNEWFDAYLAKRTQAFEGGGKPAKGPAVTAKRIADTCERMELSPVLWIEELDKVNFTETNKKWLHTLVDRVYQMDGCVVATTNTSLQTLRRELGEGIIGRLDGSRDGGGGYVCLNFSPPRPKA